MKPNEYRQRYTVTEEVRYCAEGSHTQETHASTGVLKIGRVVWIRELSNETPLEQRVLAYAEGVGLVSVKSSLLCRA